MDRTTRRGLLSRAAAVGSVATAGLLAGCGGGGNADRTTFGVPDRTTSPRETVEEPREVGTATTDPAEVVDFGSVDAPDPGPPSFRRWLPAPAEFTDFYQPGRDRGAAGYDVWSLDLDRLRDLGDAVPEPVARSVRFQRRVGLDHFGIDTYHRVVRMARDRAVAVEASLDRSAVAGTLLDSGYAEAGRHRGYYLFDRGDDPRAVALGTEALVFANAGPEDDPPADVVRSVVDARAGAIPRYHEAIDGVETLSRATGGPPMALLRKADRWPTDHDVEGLVGIGLALAFAPGVTYERRVFAFDRARKADRRLRALRGYAAESGMDEARTVEVTVEGATGEIVAVYPDDHYAEQLGDDRTDVTYPQVTWGFDHERTSEAVRVTVTHEAGTEVPESTVRIETDVDAPLPTGFSGDDNTIGPGDSVSFSIPRADTHPPYTIRLVWEAPDGSATALLGTYRIGSEPTDE